MIVNKITITSFSTDRHVRYVITRSSTPSVRLSVVCNVRAPYSGYWNFRQCFYAIWYPIGHMWPFGKNFTEIVPGEPLFGGVKHKRGSRI